MSTQPAKPKLKPAYIPPSNDEIALQVARSIIRPTLYRAGVDWFSWGHYGETLWIPPDIEGHPMVEAPPKHPLHGTEELVKANGRLAVESRVGPIWDDKPNKGRYDTGVRGIEKGWSAEEVTVRALQTQTERGVVLLTGNPEKDALAMAHSKKLVHAAKYAWADEQRKTRAMDIQKFRQNPLNANSPDPAPSALQRQAQDWLDQFAASETSKRFKCRHGCSDWSERELYVRHMLVQHKEQPADDVEPVETATAALLAGAEEAAKELDAREADLKARETKLAEESAAFDKRMKALEDKLAALDKLKGKGKGAART